MTEDKTSKQAISLCFEPNQPQRIISRLETNFPSYSFHKSMHHKSLFAHVFILSFLLLIIHSDWILIPFQPHRVPCPLDEQKLPSMSLLWVALPNIYLLKQFTLFVVVFIFCASPFSVQLKKQWVLSDSLARAALVLSHPFFFITAFWNTVWVCESATVHW